MRHRQRYLARAVMLILLLAAMGAFLMIPAVRRDFYGTCMFFTQRSVHTLIGVLKSTQVGGFYSIWLAIFQSLILPFLKPLLFIANKVVFGNISGGMLSFAGSIAGGMSCYAVGRILLGDVIGKLAQPVYKPVVQRISACLLLILGCSFPHLYPIFCFLAGLMDTPVSQCLQACIYCRVPVIIAYTLYTNAYATLLPTNVRWILAVFGIAAGSVWWVISINRPGVKRE